MSSAIFHQLVLVLVAVVVGTGYSQDGCMPPTTSDLEAVITAIIRTGDSATEPEITVSNFNVVCRAFAQRQDLLRVVSVVVEYTCTNNNNCPLGGTAVEQIESGCDSGSWTNTVFGSSEPSEIRSQSPVATLSTTARDDCSFCLSPQLAGGQSITSDPVTHCVACDSDCDEGLVRCYGSMDTECCNFYNNSLCVDECPSPFLPNSDNICVCPVGKTGENCEDVVDCGSLMDPANGAVILTNTTYNSVATYSCNDGYNLMGDTTRTCQASGSWSGTAPICTEVDCGALVDPTNGVVTVTDTTLNSTATYSCNDGYNLVGDTTRTCLASGSWSVTAPTCTAVDCGGLADPANGEVVTSGTTFSSTATYSCNNGYNLVGDTTRTCLASGSWSGDDPLCCTSNCIDCDVDSCKECNSNYKLEDGVCTPPECAIDGCSSCESDPSKCDTCEDRQRLNEDKSACTECAVTGCSNCDSDVNQCDLCKEGRLNEEKSACITGGGGGGGGSDSDDEGGGLSAGAIASVVIGCIAGTIIIGVAIGLSIFIYKNIKS